VLWDNTTRFVFTLAAAVIGLVAYFLLPSRAQIEQKLTAFYDRRGKWVLFVISFLTLGLAGILGWEFFRYNVQNGWVSVNLGLYAVLGAVILVGNIFTMRAVKHEAEHVEIVEAGMVEVLDAESVPPGQSIGDVAIMQDQPPTPPPLG